MTDDNEIRTFNYIFTNYKERFIHFARTYVDDEMLAEDITVESLMYYWENRKELDSHTNILAYILTVIKHKCLDHLRQLRVQENYIEYIKNNEERKLNLRVATLENCNPEEIFSKEVQEIVNKTLLSLPVQTRDIFIRSRYQNQSHKRIAEELNISTKAVEFHITKALKILRITLKDYLPTLLFLSI